MPTCFVVQGFGKKTDFTDGRVLDLDASYAIIKEAVEACGLQCLRADEIPHSGTIDVPMYEQLLRADLVIADLSTYNVNAAFELGVRYGLRPYATLIVAEDQLKNPFDFSHIVMRRYKHLGEDIGAKEARRFSLELQTAIKAILPSPQTDSPIYTFFPQLQPPQVAEVQAQAHDAAVRIAAVGQALTRASEATVPDAGSEDSRATRELLDAAQTMLKAGQIAAARSLLEEAHRRRPQDADVTLRLAQTIAQSALPAPEAALQAARELLRELDPDTTNNPETLSLWGSLHLQLWEATRTRDHLDDSIQAQERVYFLKQDPDVGVQLAHLFDIRAVVWLEAGEADEALTDHMLARRVRRELCRWAPSHLDQLAKEAPGLRYRLMAALWLAALAMDDAAEMARWDSAIETLQIGAEVHRDRRAQGEATLDLLRRYAELQGLQLSTRP